VIFLQIDRYSLLAVKGCSPQECWSRKNQSPLRKRVAVLAVMVVLECSNLQQSWSEQILLRRSDWTRIWRIRLRGFVPSLLFPLVNDISIFISRFHIPQNAKDVIQKSYSIQNIDFDHQNESLEEKILNFSKYSKK
jgi:hypothetical protein